MSPPAAMTDKRLQYTEGPMIDPLDKLLIESDRILGTTSRSFERKQKTRDELLRFGIPPDARIMYSSRPHKPVQAGTSGFTGQKYADIAYFSLTIMAMIDHHEVHGPGETFIKLWRKCLWVSIQLTTFLDVQYALPSTYTKTLMMSCCSTILDIFDDQVHKFGRKLIECPLLHQPSQSTQSLYAQVLLCVLHDAVMRLAFLKSRRAGSRHQDFITQAQDDLAYFGFDSYKIEEKLPQLYDKCRERYVDLWSKAHSMGADLGGTMINVPRDMNDLIINRRCQQLLSPYTAGRHQHAFCKGCFEQWTDWTEPKKHTCPFCIAGLCSMKEAEQVDMSGLLAQVHVMMTLLGFLATLHRSCAWFSQEVKLQRSIDLHIHIQAPKAR